MTYSATHLATISILDDDMVFTRYGKLIIVKCITKTKGAIPAGTLSNLYTLPAEFRPGAAIRLTTDRSSDAVISIIIAANGEVSGHNYGDAITAAAPKSCRFLNLAYFAY